MNGLTTDMALRHEMLIPCIQKIRNKLVKDPSAYLMPAEIMPVLAAFEQFMVDVAALRSVEIYAQAERLGREVVDGNNAEFITGFIHGLIAARNDLALLLPLHKNEMERARALLAKQIDETADMQYKLFVSTEKLVR